MTEDRVAIVGFTFPAESIRAYDFDGTDFALQGAQGSVGTTSFSESAALSEGRVVVQDFGSDTIRAYDFDGSTWAQVGAIAAVPVGSKCGVAYIGGTAVVSVSEDGLTAYSFDGATFTEVTDTLALTQSGRPALAPLTTSRLAYMDTNFRLIKTFDVSSPPPWDDTPDLFWTTLSPDATQGAS
jgi:hypothetical protein